MEQLERTYNKFLTKEAVNPADLGKDFCGKFQGGGSLPCMGSDFNLSHPGIR